MSKREAFRIVRRHYLLAAREYSHHLAIRDYYVRQAWTMHDVIMSLPR